MTSLTHEQKILDNIEELAFCTKCLHDFQAEKLIQSDDAWKYLCPRCHRFSGDRAGDPIY